MSLQFHAEPEELVTSLLPAWLKGMEVFVLAEHGRTLRVVEGLAQLASGPVPDRVFLRLEPFQVTSKDVRKVLRDNPNGLAVTVGDLREASLGESMLSTSAADPQARMAWRRIIRRARAGLARGGQWVGPTGATGAAPSHRYSPGAVRLARSGTKLLPIGGTSHFEPDL